MFTSSRIASPSTVPAAPANVIQTTVRGCIVGSDSSVLSLIVVKHREGEIPGVTDDVLGPEAGGEDLVVL